MPIRHFTRHGLADQSRNSWETPIFVPVDFDIARCVRPEFRKYREEVAFLFHTIYLRQHMLFDKEHRHANKPVNLRFAYLRDRIPCGRRHLRAVLDDVLLAGGLTCDGKQIGGVKSYGYALGPLFSHRFKQVTISNRFILKKMATDRFIDENRLPEVHKWLLSKLRMIKIDTVAAEQHIENDPEKRRLPLANSIMQIDGGGWFYNPSPYGRVFTNITNIAGDLRQFLSVYGRRLVMIDISNSQPLFLAKMIRDSRNCVRRRISGLQEELTDTCKNSGGRGTHTLTMDTFLIYQQAVETGRLYEQVAAATNRTRDEVKQPVLISLTCNSRIWDNPNMRLHLAAKDPEQDLIYRTMHRLYPDVMQYAAAVKKHDHRLMAQRLQRAESDFIFKRVCRHIMNRWPDLWIATIHDCIMCLPEDARTVRGVMEEEFRNIGTEAVLREEPA